MDSLLRFPLHFYINLLWVFRFSNFGCFSSLSNTEESGSAPRQKYMLPTYWFNFWPTISKKFEKQFWLCKWLYKACADLKITTISIHFIHFEALGRFMEHSIQYSRPWKNTWWHSDSVYIYIYIYTKSKWIKLNLDMNFLVSRHLTSVWQDQRRTDLMAQKQEQFQESWPSGWVILNSPGQAGLNYWGKYTPVN